MHARLRTSDRGGTSIHPSPSFQLPNKQVGTMQAMGYVARYVGNVVGATLGTILYNKQQWHWGLAIGQIYLLNALVAVAAVLPFAYHLDDPNHVTTVRTLRDQMGDIWHMVQRRTIYRPMAFVAVRVVFLS